MAFFTHQYLDFFRELQANNRKEWFDAHRKTYEDAVKAPFKAFVDQLVLGIQGFDPEVQGSSKDSIFRINRDIRFSKDKAPYKSHMSAAFSARGKMATDPGYYFEIGAEGIMIGGGIYSVEKEDTHKIRMEIDYNQEEFADLVGDLVFVKHFGALQGDQNKVLPAPFKESVKTQPLIANKNFYYMASLPASLVVSDALLSTLLAYFQAGFPINQFLRRALSDE
jgi:uncharacterized protein (TIGR02453 family)